MIEDAGSHRPERKIGRIVLGDQVYELLKERILDQLYAPGQKLNIDALVRELTVSSTPIREALSRLAAEGLVNAAPFVGFTVSPMPSPAFYHDLYAYRRLVEPWAASEAARLRPAGPLAAMRTAVAAMQAGSLSRQYRKNRGFTEADDRFHRALAEASGNEVLRKTYAELRVHLHMSRLFITREQDAEITYREHLDILEAVEAGSPERAAELMRGHLDASRHRLLE
jgi:DNA-binding GntR family transcriptional regulator